MTEINVRRELEMIARLQQVDNQLRDLEMEKGDLPMLVERMRSNIEKYEQEQVELKDRLGELAKQRRSNDGQMELLKVKQEKYNEQLFAVTTNREYDAIQNEIAANKAQVEAIETSQVALMEEEEMLSGQHDELIQRVKEVSSELSERETELGTKTEETEAEELELQHERDKLRVRIKKPLLAHYERIRAVRSGTGAAHIYAGACGACFAVIPPQRQAEIRKMEDIILCESCGVILLPEEEEMDLD